MTEILLGPTVTDGTTTKVTNKKDGKVFFKKQILPHGKFNYKGADLDLTDVNLSEFVKGFKAKAFDETTVQFSTAEGAHNNDPKLRTGSLVDVEHVPGKGLWGYFDLSKEGSEYVEKFPKAGVSARLVLNHKRADGKEFPGAIQHILLTNVPRMTGMSAWEKVELSDSETIEGDTFDFSDENVAAVQAVPSTSSGGTVVVKTNTNTNTNPSTTTEVGNKVELSKEQHEFLLSMMEDAKKFEQVFSTTEGESGKKEQEVTLPNDVKLAIEQNTKDIKDFKVRSAREFWTMKKRELARDGVPPSVLDLADAVMLQTDDEVKVFDLSTAEGTVQVSAKELQLNQLEALKGTVPLGEESGHGIGGKEPNEQSFSDEQIDAFLAENGI
jgi:hypothetical protein